MLHELFMTSETDLLMVFWGDNRGRKKNMNTASTFDALSFDQLSEVVGGSVAYDIGYQVGGVTAVIVQLLTLKNLR